MAQWAAPTANGPVNALVRVPGSKSLTNRALVLAALAQGPSTLRQPLRARDTLLMIDALRALGATINEDGDVLRVTPHPIKGAGAVDCGLAGTVMRFVPPIATLAPPHVATRFDGDARARERPLRPLVEALRSIGARIDATGDGALPITVYGGGPGGGVVTLDASASSQLLSALLLAAPRWPKGIEVHQVGALPSMPHVNMTVTELRAAGAQVDATEPHVWRVAPGPLAGRDVTIEPDLSNAAPFLAAALVTGGRVTIADWPERTSQPGAMLPDLLAAMGGTVSRTSEGLTVQGGSTIDGIDADLADASELLTVIAALAALAGGPSRLRGVAHVRGHETDRLAALAAELGALGSDVEETTDGLAIRPRPLHGGVFRTYGDHRLATAAAVVGLATPGVVIEDIGATAKTMPDFTERWRSTLGGDV